MALIVPVNIPKQASSFCQTAEKDLRKHSNTAQFSYRNPHWGLLGKVTAEVSDIGHEKNPCGFLSIFKRFTAEEIGRDPSFVQCVSLPKSNKAVLFFNHPGSMPFFFFGVTSVKIERTFKCYVQGSVSLEFQQANGQKHTVIVAPKLERLVSHIHHPTKGPMSHILIDKQV